MPAIFYVGLEGTWQWPAKFPRPRLVELPKRAPEAWLALDYALLPPLGPQWQLVMVGGNVDEAWSF